jgi:hypothetical protein
MNKERLTMSGLLRRFAPRNDITPALLIKNIFIIVFLVIFIVMIPKLTGDKLFHSKTKYTLWTDQPNIKVSQAIKLTTGIIDPELLTKLVKEFQKQYGQRDMLQKGVTYNVSLTVPANYLAKPKTIIIEVNIPEYAVRVFQNYQGKQLLIKPYACGVGVPEYATPIGFNVIDYLVEYPWWTPPPSKWAIDEEVQAPGEGNPLGKVMITFESEYGIHGTKDRNNLNKPSSHGCVRMLNADIIEISQFLKQSIPYKELDYTYPGKPANSPKSKIIYFSHSILVKIIYEPIVFNDPVVTIYPDIYHTGLLNFDYFSKRMEELKAGSSVLIGLDRTKVDLYLKKARKEKVAFSLPDILQ